MSDAGSEGDGVSDAGTEGDGVSDPGTEGDGVNGARSSKKPIAITSSPVKDTSWIKILCRCFNNKVGSVDFRTHSMAKII